MKKKIPLLSIALALITAICIFRYYHPTHYKFNDRYIIGNTKENITEKYGEPYNASENTVTYMIRDNTPEFIMGYDDSLWYVIVFENGVAEKVYLRRGYIGG